jgi:hypothetical protein
MRPFGILQQLDDGAALVLVGALKRLDKLRSRGRNVGWAVEE